MSEYNELVEKLAAEIVAEAFGEVEKVAEDQELKSKKESLVRQFLRDTGYGLAGTGVGAAAGGLSGAALGALMRNPEAGAGVGGILGAVGGGIAGSYKATKKSQKKDIEYGAKNSKHPSLNKYETEYEKDDPAWQTLKKQLASGFLGPLGWYLASKSNREKNIGYGKHLSDKSAEKAAEILFEAQLQKIAAEEAYEEAGNNEEEALKVFEELGIDPEEILQTMLSK